MKTQEILSIVALSLLGLCLLCGLAKMAMRGDSAKKNCDKACSMAVFAAVVLLAISQLIGETDGYCQIMPGNEQARCSSHDAGGLCVKQGTGKWKPPGGAGCCRVGENCLPEQPICCPNAADCGTINDQSSDNATHNPKGVVTPCKKDVNGNCTDQKSVAQWWNKNCWTPPQPPSQ